MNTHDEIVHILQYTTIVIPIEGYEPSIKLISNLTFCTTHCSRWHTDRDNAIVKTKAYCNYNANQVIFL